MNSHVSTSILNKITVKPVRQTYNKSCYCYKCSDIKPKCVCRV